MTVFLYPMSKPNVIIIILNWNGCDDTLACLTSLNNLDYPAYKVIVVDNGSVDDSIAVIRAAFPQVTYVEAGTNLGFVGGNNLGLEYAHKMGAEYTLLLNNDTEVAPNFLQKLVEAAEEDPTVGVAGPMIYYHATPKVIWSAGGVLNWRRGSTRMVGIGEIDNDQFDGAPHPMDFITGCAFLIKMPVYEQVGGFDSRFFAYYEETEWCVRVARAGYRILLVPQAKVWHKISPQARESSPRVNYYMTRNRLLFLKCIRAGWLPWINTFYEYARTLLSWTIKPRWRYKAPQRRAMIRAILDFLHGQWGEAVSL
jgi:GT2 family glycosyltransferase